MIGHDDFCCNAIFLKGDIFQSGQEKGRIFFIIFAPAGFFHHSGSGEKRFYIHTDELCKNEAHLGEFAKSAADTVGYGKAEEMMLIGKSPEHSFFLVRHACDGDICLALKLGCKSMNGRGRFQGNTGFGNRKEQDFGLPSQMAAFPFHLVRQRQESRGIHIVAGEENFRETFPFFLRHHIPERPAVKVKKHLVSQVGPADADGNHYILLFGKSFQL